MSNSLQTAVRAKCKTPRVPQHPNYTIKSQRPPQKTQFLGFLIITRVQAEVLLSQILFIFLRIFKMRNSDAILEITGMYIGVATVMTVYLITNTTVSMGLTSMY